MASVRAEIVDDGDQIFIIFLHQCPVMTVPKAVMAA